jgi:hypothetical protein
MARGKEEPAKRRLALLLVMDDIRQVFNASIGGNLISVF